jgi:putative selenium metabolism hydrolase
MDTSGLIAFTQSILRERSLSGEERAVAEMTAARMCALGFDRVSIDPNGSVIGVVQGHLPGPTLLFDAHTDTVVAVPADWSHDPFGGEIVDGKLYGRGAADMKGALAAMTFAAGSAERERMAGRVVISASVLEEVYEGGALADVMEEMCPDFVVIGEATQLNLARGGRGRAEILVEAVGRSAHSSSPGEGLCAVHEMIKIIAAFDAMPLPSHPVTGKGLMALTDILSQPYPAHSVIPNTCQATYDRRLVPGESIQSVLAELRALPGLEGIQWDAKIVKGEERTGTGRSLPVTKFFPAWVLDERHELVQMALRGLRAAGFDPALGAYGYCTNAAYSAGVAGVPTIGFGPGKETDAHIVDEYIAVEELIRAAQGYTGIIAGVLYTA